MSGLRDEEISAIVKGPQEYIQRKREGFQFVANHKKSTNLSHQVDLKLDGILPSESSEDTADK